MQQWVNNFYSITNCKIFHENIETTEWLFILYVHWLFAFAQFRNSKRISQKSRTIFRIKWRIVKLVVYFMRFYFLYRREWEKIKLSKTRVVTMYMLSDGAWKKSFCQMVLSLNNFWTFNFKAINLFWSEMALTDFMRTINDVNHPYEIFIESQTVNRHHTKHSTIFVQRKVMFL